jgi:hypothetical protein
MTNLVRVVAPHFVAGLIAVDGVVAEARPLELGWSWLYYSTATGENLS